MRTCNKIMNLHSRSEGTGQPTVILEAGAGDCHLTWSLVQPKIAETSRVISYDRAGLGFSESTSEPRKLQQFTNELEQLLKQENVKGPLILVGHSLGGLLMLHYALLYPENVVGIVLVDSAHEQQMNHPAASAQKYLKLFKIMLFLSRFGIMRLLAKMTLRNVDIDDETIKKYRSLQSSPKVLRAFLAEMTEYTYGYPPFHDKLKPILNNTPLIVITRGKNIRGTKKLKELDAYQKELQKEFLALSLNSKQIIAENSNHYVQFTEPELIVDAILHIQSEYNKDN